MKMGSEKRSVFAAKPRRWNVDDLLKVAGGFYAEDQLDGCKSGSGQDNQGKPGFC